MAIMKFSYPQDPEALFRFLSDPEVTRRRSEWSGDKDINISVSNGAVTNIRKVQADVPGFAKKLLNPVNTVTEVKAWNAANKTATLKVDIQGAPVKVTGDIKIVPSGSGSEYIVDFKVSCSIPFIGGQLEKHVTGITEEGMRKEYDWNKAEAAKVGA
jgi:hypothetical protein